ncbi:hypothetical protein KM427_11790 [Nocardioides sp. LMS-CY]|uniref:Uncharacterized protein n=1 Tax=Nocardioides soli TaxID=1036020 RepID=A0A7W4VZZ9_9ACTN|nr:MULTISPECIES: hypothetical protein [Nocardioides]MBB3044820.1 hypothetical protein [Nocardioides soli]QWF24309.1 hypothetical protein KM427_11790 [Nocardioides sp. LMS-CY]
MSDVGSDDLARLLRWENAGGAWRVLHRTDDEIAVALLTCDGGTEMERLTSGSADVREHVGDRDVS